MHLVCEVRVELGEEGVAVGGVREPGPIPVPFPDHTHNRMLGEEGKLLCQTL